MANVTNYGWAYVHPTKGQAQARGDDKTLQFQSGTVDSNKVGTASGSTNLTFDYNASPNQLNLVGNMTASGHMSASNFYGNGSNLSGIASFPYTGDAVITGSLNVTGDLTASNYIIENTIELNNAGSSKFGNSNDDSHIFTGSVSIGSSGSNIDVQYKLASSQLKVPGLQVNYRTTGLNVFTASASDYIVGMTNVSASTVRLLSAATVGSGSILVIKDEVGNPRDSAKKITISASAGQQVDLQPHTTIQGTLGSLTLYSNGHDAWFVI